MASQGPANLKVKDKDNAFGPQFKWGGSLNFVNGTVLAEQADTNWLEHVSRRYGNSNLENILRAFAVDILGYYFEKYSDVVDGYWFDHARDDDSAQYIDTQLVKQVLNKYDPTAVVAFNAGFGPNVPLTVRSPFYEDFTAGHPNKIGDYSHFNLINLPMVTSIEETAGSIMPGLIGSRSVGHIFMTTLESSWNAVGHTVDLQPAWDRAQAVEWMRRTVSSEGSWTWNVPRQGYLTGEFSLLQSGALNFIKEVSDCVYNPDLPSDSSCYDPWILPTPAPTPIPVCDLPVDDNIWSYTGGGSINKLCGATYWSATRCASCAMDSGRNLYYTGTDAAGQTLSARKACPNSCLLTCAQWVDEPNVESC